MALRVQLIHASLGSLVIDKADPVGINDMTQTVKRSSEYEGVTYEVIFDLDFIKDARRFIKEGFETQGGIDCDMQVNFFEYDPNERRWLPYANGKINFQKYDLYEDKVTVTIEQVGFQTRVLNLLETNVDLSTTQSIDGIAIPETTFINPLLHSKTIIKNSDGEPQDSFEHQFLDVFTFNIPRDPIPTDPGDIILWLAAGHPFSVDREALFFGQADTSISKFKELTNFFQTNFSYVQMDGMGGASAKTDADYIAHLLAHKDGRFEVFRATEAGQLNGVINWNIKHRIVSDDSAGADIEHDLGDIEILYWYELRNSNDDILDIQVIGRQPHQDRGVTTFPYFEAQFPISIALQIGYKIYVYHTVRVFGSYKQPFLFQAGVITHNFYVQSSPPAWLIGNAPYALGVHVNRGGKEWESAIEQNVSTPGDDANWTLIGDWTGSPVSTSINLTAATTAVSSTSKMVLLYDAFLTCCRYLTNQFDCFKSDLLGRTELGYDIDGKGALIGWTNGGNLRKLKDKTIFANLKDLIDFTNSLFCVGFGFEIVNGKSILRLEQRAFFYKKDQKVLSLGRVYNIKRTLDPKKFYNEIQYGYDGKIDISQSNATDEFNTVRKGGIPIVNTKNKLNVSTKVRTGGYPIENQRRLQFSTVDSKLDDELFAIVLLRNGTGGFKSKKDEGYAEIVNVIDSPSGYNYDIQPARNLQNWYQFLASIIIRSPNKVIKFTYGEVNYVMASRKTGEVSLLHENGQFDLTSIEALYEPFKDSFTHQLTRADFKFLKENPYGFIEYEDQHGEIFNGFISDSGIEHNSFKGTADFELLKVFRP